MSIAEGDRSHTSLLLHAVVRAEQEKNRQNQTLQKIIAVKRFLEQKWIDLRNTVSTQQFGLSLALGYKNPTAVEDIVEEYGIEHIIPDKEYQKVELGQLVRKRSFELRQMDALIAAAQKGYTQVAFQWLDPQSDSSFGFGPAMIPQRSAQQAKIEYLKTEREKLEATILQRAYQAQTLHSSMREAYENASFLKHSSEEVLQKIVSELSAGTYKEIGLESADLEEAIQLHIGNIANAVHVVTTYRIAQAEIDRLILQGFHEKLFDQFMEAR